MTATDELRRLLDERGVWHEDIVDATLWRGSDGIAYTAAEVYHGDMKPSAEKLVIRHMLTPEQAIAATLGDTDATRERHGVETCRTVYLVEISDDLLKSWYTIAVYQCREAAESRAEALRREVDGVRHFARVSKVKVVDE